MSLLSWYVNTCEHKITYNCEHITNEVIVIYDNNQDTLTHHNQERDLWATKKPPDYQKKLMSPYQDFYICALNILQDETLPV